MGCKTIESSPFQNDVYKRDLASNFKNTYSDNKVYGYLVTYRKLYSKTTSELLQRIDLTNSLVFCFNICSVRECRFECDFISVKLLLINYYVFITV